MIEPVKVFEKDAKHVLVYKAVVSVGPNACRIAW